MNSRFKLKGKMLTHLLYPVILGLILVAVGIYEYVHNMTAGLVIIVAGAIYVIVTMIMYFWHKPVVMRDLINFAVDYAKVQKILLRDLAIPYGLMDVDGNVLWLNKELENLFDSADVKGQNISEVFTDLTVADFMTTDDSKEFAMSYKEKVYRIVCRRINVSDVFNSTQVLAIEEERDCLIAFYMFDETENKRLLKENSDQRLVAGLIYIDNYEEALESVEDVKKSLLTALIERKINQFGANIDAVVKKLEKDKYFIAFRYKYLEGLQATKFEILDEVRSVNIGNEMDMTISIGIGYNGDTYPGYYD